MSESFPKQIENAGHLRVRAQYKGTQVREQISYFVLKPSPRNCLQSQRPATPMTYARDTYNHNSSQSSQTWASQPRARGKMQLRVQAGSQVPLIRENLDYCNEPNQQRTRPQDTERQSQGSFKRLRRRDSESEATTWSHAVVLQFHSRLCPSNICMLTKQQRAMKTLDS